jgi:hypothetical protein
MEHPSSTVGVLTVPRLPRQRTIASCYAGPPGVYARQQVSDRGGAIPRQDPPRRNALPWESVFPTYLARYGAAFARAGWTRA